MKFYGNIFDMSFVNWWIEYSKENCPLTGNGRIVSLVQHALFQLWSPVCLHIFWDGWVCETIMTVTLYMAIDKSHQLLSFQNWLRRFCQRTHKAICSASSLKSWFLHGIDNSGSYAGKPSFSIWVISVLVAMLIDLIAYFNSSLT